MDKVKNKQEQWEDAISDAVFMEALRKYMPAAELQSLLRDRDRLVGLHMLAKASYQAGFARGQRARAALEQLSERPTLRPLEPDEASYLASCPDDDEALKARRREHADYDDQAALWDLLYPQGKPVRVEPNTELAGAVLADES